MHKGVTILTENPTIIPIAEMELSTLGIEGMMEWVKMHRPECLPDDNSHWTKLFPHEGVETPESVPEEASLIPERLLTANELLVELAGRKCYDSFGLKAGRKSNKDYIANTQAGEVPHASILYHAKMTFFFAGISRRVSHEIIRNYVGSDRDEEGSPSQESTRFTHHYGYFIMPPRYLVEQPALQGHFRNSMQTAYNNYLHAVSEDVAHFQTNHGKPPTGIEKKRIYEAASSFLPHQAETSFVWTTNPAAIAKFVKERAHEAADLEIQRFAKVWRNLCYKRWPNLFPQPFMSKID